MEAALHYFSLVFLQINSPVYVGSRHSVSTDAADVRLGRLGPKRDLSLDVKLRESIGGS